MHPDLESWLNDVWRVRMKLIAMSKEQGYMRGRGSSDSLQNDGVWEIYCMYNAIAEGGASGAESHLGALQKQLIRLEQATKAELQTQVGVDMELREPGWMANQKLSVLKGFHFFHYSPTTSLPAVYRIYINCTAAARGDVYKGILVDHGLFKVAGLSSTKVASPTVGVRSDAIVVYCSDEKSKEACLDCIDAYHKTAKGNFVGILPKLVTKARGMDGVGVAMEPPNFQLVSTGGKMYAKDARQSFGGYRSELIFMALERTRFQVPEQTTEDRKQAFKNRVEKYFRKAGIDPDRPALQEDVEEGLPALSTLKEWSNRVREALMIV